MLYKKRPSVCPNRGRKLKYLTRIFATLGVACAYHVVRNLATVPSRPVALSGGNDWHRDLLEGGVVNSGWRAGKKRRLLTVIGQIKTSGRVSLVLVIISLFTKGFGN